MVLDKIVKENDIKNLTFEELETLPDEIRSFLIEKISNTGGHLASNLGVVELTMALHLSLELPKDKIIWDVGHQSYTHKILTGRKEGFEELRKYGGLSGFPKRKESPCDSFDTGHSSTSISAGLGYVKGRDIKNENYRVVSVIGDGSLTGGMAYEALNNASELNRNFIIVLNDNNMSISKNVGGMSKYLNGLRTGKKYTSLKTDVEKVLNRIPMVGNTTVNTIKKAKNSIKQLLVANMFFEDMGITYLGPVDGHDMKALMKAFREAKQVKGAVLVHVITKKGKGYLHAEIQPSKYHGTGPFQIHSGETKEAKGGKKVKTYTDVFGKVLYKEAKTNENIVAITAAMSEGTGLVPFSKTFKDRFFDVGIAEAHAVTFAAGLAASGMKPVFAVYSSFLQRAYDQIIHDVCIQNLPVVFAIDRAGLVGNDGETHQGIFDVSFLNSIPNMTVMAPKNKWELASMLRYALQYEDGPIALRYPRGTAYEGLKEFDESIEYGKSEILYEEEKVAIVAVGHMMAVADKVREQIKERGYECSLVNARFLKPVDASMLELLAKEHQLVVVLEENLCAGGYASELKTVADKLSLDIHIMGVGIEDMYVEHGSIEQLREEVLMDEDTITKRIVSKLIGIDCIEGNK